MKYQRNEGHNVVQDLRRLASEIENRAGDLWNLADECDIYKLDAMDHDEYMRAKKALKKMIKMALKTIKDMPSRETYHKEMER